MKILLALFLGVLSLALFSGISARASSSSESSEASQIQRMSSVEWGNHRHIDGESPRGVGEKRKSDTPSHSVLKRPPLRVLVDIGHGGRDLGAPGWNGVLEKHVASRVGQGVKRELERYGKLKDVAVEVRLTRTEDVFVPLRGRVKLANDWGADLFVSIHANSSESPRAQGFEVYFLADNATDADANRLARTENAMQKRTTQSEVASILSDVQKTLHVNQSSRFAEAVFQAMTRRLRPNGRGVRQAPFTVLAGTQMPALLVEVGYLTNVEEAKKLTSAPYLKRIANAISTGIVEFAMHLKKLG